MTAFNNTIWGSTPDTSLVVMRLTRTRQNSSTQFPSEIAAVESINQYRSLLQYLATEPGIHAVACRVDADTEITDIKIDTWNTSWRQVKQDLQRGHSQLIFDLEQYLSEHGITTVTTVVDKSQMIVDGIPVPPPSSTPI
jgi:hypothetical protein